MGTFIWIVLFIEGKDRNTERKHRKTTQKENTKRVERVERGRNYLCG
jgi:hypothetical protein